MNIRQRFKVLTYSSLTQVLIVLCVSKMAIIWPQEPFFCRKLNIKDIYPKEKAYKENCFLFACDKRKRGSDVTSPWRVKVKLGPLVSGAGTIAGSTGGNSGRLFLAFGGLVCARTNGISLLGKIY